MAKSRPFSDFQKVMAQVSYPGFEFRLGGNTANADAPWLQIICANAIDTDTGLPTSWRGRKWRLSYFMTDTEIVQTAWAAVERALMHEAREMFKFKGLAIYNRHLNVHQLVALATDPASLDTREDAMNGLGG